MLIWVNLCTHIILLVQDYIDCISCILIYVDWFFPLKSKHQEKKNICLFLFCCIAVFIALKLASGTLKVCSDYF